MGENQYWKVCEALDNEKRMELMRYLLADRKEFPCVIEIAEKFKLGIAATSVYLKKMLDVGLVASKREERRIYYRAFATTAEGIGSSKYSVEDPSFWRFARNTKTGDATNLASEIGSGAAFLRSKADSSNVGVSLKDHLAAFTQSAAPLPTLRFLPRHPTRNSHETARKSNMVRCCRTRG